jgi:hypothetical protein
MSSCSHKPAAHCDSQHLPFRCRGQTKAGLGHFLRGASMVSSRDVPLKRERWVLVSKFPNFCLSFTVPLH